MESTQNKSTLNKTSNVSNFLSTYSIGGISIPEIALLGAAGYVVWRNRSKIESLLSKAGIEVPAAFSGDFSDLVQSGASLLAGKNQGAEPSEQKDAQAPSQKSIGQSQTGVAGKTGTQTKDSSLHS